MVERRAPEKFFQRPSSLLVVVLAASFGLILTTLIFVTGRITEQKTACQPSGPTALELEESCDNNCTSNRLLNAKAETVIEATCPQVVGNVVGARGADDMTSIYPATPSYVRFKRHFDKELGQDLIARSSWSDEEWSEATVQVMKDNTEHGVVIIALSNYGMREMTMNWIASLKLNRYKKFVVLCFDFEMYRFLCEHGLQSNAALIPASWVKAKLETSFVGWGDSKYHAMLHGKLLVIIEILKRGFTILHCDVDLVFLNEFVVQHILAEDKDVNADFTYMVDNSGGGLDIPNGGFWLARPTELMVDVWTQTFQLATTEKKYVVDQAALSHVLKHHKKDIRISRHFRPLSRSLYPSGLYIKQKVPQNLLIYPMVAHANWLVGLSRKKNLLKEINMWYIKEDFAK